METKPSLLNNPYVEDNEVSTVTPLLPLASDFSFGKKYSS